VSSNSLSSVKDLPEAAAVETAAGGFTAVGTQLAGAVEKIATGWSRLSAPGVYEAPEASQVHSAMADGPVKVAEYVVDDVKNIRDILRAYSGVLADLETRRANLLKDIAHHGTLVASNADPLNGSSPGAQDLQDELDSQGDDLARRVSAFNSDVDAADDQCAQALRSLSKYRNQSTVSKWVHHASDEPAGSAIGFAETVAKQTRVLRRAVSNGALPSIDLKPTLAWKQDSFAHLPGNRLWLPENHVRSKTPLPDPKIKTKSHWFLAEPETSAKHLQPKALEYGGRALGVAGAALTLGSAAADQWKEDSQTHPEWSTTQKAVSAGKTTLFEGGGAVAGAWGGAVVGAEVGAVIGSIIPGPGTAIGGIVGGLIGGAIGSGIGEKIGAGAKDLWDNLW